MKTNNGWESKEEWYVGVWTIVLIAGLAIACLWGITGWERYREAKEVIAENECHIAELQTLVDNLVKYESLGGE